MKQVKTAWQGKKPLHTFIYDQLNDNIDVRYVDGNLEKMNVRQDTLINSMSVLLAMLVDKEIIIQKELANILNLYEDSFEIE